MIEQTFIHIQGIGPKTEKGLWRRGIRTWKEFLSHRSPVLSPARDQMVRAQLKDSIENRTNIRFFVDRLPASELWRIYNEFKQNSVYLDIETNGDNQGQEDITVIGLYDGRTVHTFVSGKNLYEFEMAIASYEMVITFSGSCFDLPVIRRSFPGITLPPAHIDLRFFLKRLGYKGGLKAIEKERGLLRESDIDGMDGYEAVRLWRAYEWGDQRALELLIKYNTADIVNLKPLMEMGYDELKKAVLTAS